MPMDLLWENSSGLKPATPHGVSCSLHGDAGGRGWGNTWLAWKGMNPTALPQHSHTQAELGGAGGQRDPRQSTQYGHTKGREAPG